MDRLVENRGHELEDDSSELVALPIRSGLDAVVGALELTEEPHALPALGLEDQQVLAVYEMIPARAVVSLEHRVADLAFAEVAEHTQMISRPRSWGGVGKRTRLRG